MNFSQLERRTQPRTQAFVPITLQYAHCDHETPAQLLDLSCGGAAVLLTADNSPVLGQYLQVKFEAPTNDGASESRPREELALVVNIRRPERGIARIGVRFIHNIDSGKDFTGPKDILSDQRRSMRKSGLGLGDRWSLQMNGPAAKSPGHGQLTTLRAVPVSVAYPSRDRQGAGSVDTGN